VPADLRDEIEDPVLGRKLSMLIGSVGLPDEDKHLSTSWTGLSRPYTGLQRDEIEKTQRRKRGVTTRDTRKSMLDMKEGLAHALPGYPSGI